MCIYIICVNFDFSSLIPDPVLDQLRQKKSQSLNHRRTTGHGRVGRPPGSLNKNSSKNSVGKALSGKGAKGGKAGAKHGKVRRSNSGNNVSYEKQRFGNLRGKVALTVDCCCYWYLYIFRYFTDFVRLQ